MSRKIELAKIKLADGIEVDRMERTKKKAELNPAAWWMWMPIL